MAEHLRGTAAPKPDPAGSDDDGNDATRVAPSSSQAPPAERTKRSPLVLIGEIGGAISALAALVGLILVFAPGLKPDPPAAAKGAVFSGITTDANISRADYLRRLDRGVGGYTRPELRRRGVIVGFHLAMTGHKNQELPLRWGVYSAVDGAQLLREKATTLKPEAPTDEASLQVWAPLPSGKGPYYVLLQLFEEDGLATITQARSACFAGLAARAQGRSPCTTP